MDKLWAPWRIKYITEKKGKICIFCRAYKQKTKDKQNYILFRSSQCFAILNTFPYNNGHAMVVPNRHIADVTELNDDELLDMNKCTVKTIKILKKIMHPEGFNVGMNIGSAAGAGIANHLHMHIVPRWTGDTNCMPIIAKTKVISQSLVELYKLFTKELCKQN